jgi:molybdenum cofactor cytidylyltransferase
MTPPRWPPARALLLAAGSSTRMGGHPKGLLPVGTESAIGRIVRIAREVVGPTAVVVGAHADTLRRAVTAGEARWIENPEWSRGRTGSIQAGLDTLGVDAPVVLWPADHPFVEAKTVATLVQTAERESMAVWVIPTWGGRGGHPVWMAPPALEAIRELAPDRPLRALHARFGPQVVRRPVADAGVVADVDTPEDFFRHLTEWRDRGAP